MVYKTVEKRHINLRKINDNNTGVITVPTFWLKKLNAVPNETTFVAELQKGRKGLFIALWVDK